MIIPAVTAKVIHFKNKNREISYYPKEGFNIISIMTDSGKILDVEMLSNGRNLKSLKEYLNNKTMKNIKENKIKTLSLDLAYIDESNPFYSKIKKEEEKIKTKDPSLTGINLRKEAIHNVIKRELYIENLIKNGSVIRLALAVNKDLSKVTSKSIIVKRNDKGKEEYSNKGVYFYSVLKNSIPIELSPIYNKDGVYTGIFSIKTSSNLINKEQIIYLLKHQIKTLVHSINQNHFRPLFITFDYFQFKNFMNDHNYTTLVNIYKNINSYKKYLKENENNILSLEQMNKLIKMFESLKDIFTNSLDDISQKFCAVFPIFADSNFISNAIFSVSENNIKSPIGMLPESIINLNFSTYNYNIKNEIKTFINEYLKQISMGSIPNVKLIATYRLPSSNIFGDSNKGWGFLSNNIIKSNFVLSVKNSHSLINYIEKNIVQPNQSLQRDQIT